MSSLLTQPWFPEVPVRIRAVQDYVVARKGDAILGRKIDHEMDNLETALRQLRSTRNACQPLLRLPPEILGEIADILATIWPAQTGYPSTPSTSHQRDPSEHPLGWVLFGQVCRMLRGVLLDRAHLWANNICSITRSFEDVIPYCRDLPLSIDLVLRDHDLDPQDPGIDFVKRRMGRSQSLLIEETVRGHSQETLLSALDAGLFSQTSFPYLKQLTLDRWHRNASPASARHISPEIHELPEMDAPHLSSIYLRNFLVPFPATNLTSLRLDYVHTIDPPYTAAQLLGLLERCQKLRRLRTTACLPDWPTQDIAAITLPALQLLWLKDNIIRCAGLWRRIRTPNLVSLKSDLIVDATLQDASSHLSLVKPLLGMPDMVTSVTGLSVAEDISLSMFNFVLLVPGASQYEGEFEWQGPFAGGYSERVLLTFENVDCRPPHLPNTISTIADAINCDKIETLDLNTSSEYDSATWVAQFARFSNAITLYIDSDTPNSTLLLSLAAPASGQTISLPRLRFLWIAMLDLRESSDSDEDEPFDAPQGPGRLEFIRMLSSRRHAGVQLQHLRIDALLMDPAQASREFIPRLKALVPLVDVRVTLASPVSDSEDDEGGDSE